MSTEEKETKVSSYQKIICDISFEKFFEILSDSSRKSREIYFHRHRVKPPKNNNRLLKSGVKLKIRVTQLFNILKVTQDNEMIEEILRTWLLKKRSLLSKTLDELDISHVNGLTESDDVKKFEILTKDQIQNMIPKLESVANIDDIKIYLRFMGVSSDKL